ncbi:cysteine hydrolase family protein [Sphaerimonospora sp. CA-214678]|uniref:cysteine hydrolase family protein n=1 Tax=Sphaerimonospora sp. CA-214678 TaxID=3240029 RepID=UPI003D8E03DA
MDDIRLELLAEMCSDPGSVAVVVIDMQRDFCSGSGAFARAGIDVSANERIVTRAGEFVDFLRARGVLVVWVRQLSSDRYMSPAIERRLRRAPERLELCRQGSPGAELADGLRVHEADVTIEKFRYSAFLGSSLDQLLRSSGIQTVVLLGTAANGCVDTTARDAAQREYDVVVAGDLTGHTDARLAAAALDNLDRHFAVVCSADEIERAVAAGLEPRPEQCETRTAQNQREGQTHAV